MRNKVIDSRVKLGMTQRDLSRKCGVSESVIRDLESGVAIPSEENIEKIKVALGIPKLV